MLRQIPTKGLIPMSKRGIDISSYQDSSLAFLRKKKKQGAEFAIVKLTEGTDYLSPKAGAQIRNGLKVFDSVGVYHFFHGAGLVEAKYFLSYVKSFGLDKSTVLAIDVEYQGLPAKSTSQINVFLKHLRDHGYKHVITYGSRSWFTSNRIHRAGLIDKAVWVAAYGTDRPGINNADAWQDTDNWYGVDGDLDFTGKLSGTKTAAKSKKAAYWSNDGLYEVLSKRVNVYGTLKFEAAHKRRSYYTKGSRVYGKAVKYGKFYRIELSKGNFITANKSMVKLVRKTS